MHDVTPLRIATQVIGNYLAKGFRVKTLVDGADGCMHLVFGSGHASLRITVGSVHRIAKIKEGRPYEPPFRQ
jgi:hypothetical protein